MRHRRVILLPVAAIVVLGVAASSFAGFAGTDLFLPSVGSGPGVAPAVWYTTVWVYNPGTRRADVTFSLLERTANLSPLTFTDSIPPGDTRRYDDAVQTMFGLQTFGALRVTSSVRLIVGSRIYSQPGSAVVWGTENGFSLPYQATTPSGSPLFRYQLTVIGQFAQAIVAGKIAGNRFVPPPRGTVLHRSQTRHRGARTGDAEGAAQPLQEEEQGRSAPAWCGSRHDPFPNRSCSRPRWGGGFEVQADGVTPATGERSGRQPG